MAAFPRVQSPCPYKGDPAAIMAGDDCRLCRRRVHDLSAMTDAERRAFLHGCAEEVCVSYRVPAYVAAAAALSVMAAAPTAAAAGSTPPVQDLELMVIIVGGITDPKAIDYVETEEDGAAPELPVEYDEPAAAEAKAEDEAE